MDFMTDLPECQRFDAIMVVVDRFTKMAHFTPCTKTITSEQCVDMFIDRVVRHHGIPENIITDRGAVFDSKFWKTFWTTLQTKPSMSTAYHPQTDGQTERVNSILNQYLRVYTNFMQDNWVQLLPFAEFTYNNAVHSATMVTPFMANYGVNPRFKPLTSATALTDDPNKLSVRLKAVHEFLSSNLEHARETMK